MNLGNSPSAESSRSPASSKGLKSTEDDKLGGFQMSSDAAYSISTGPASPGSYDSSIASSSLDMEKVLDDYSESTWADIPIDALDGEDISNEAKSYEVSSANAASSGEAEHQKESEIGFQQLRTMTPDSPGLMKASASSASHASKVQNKNFSPPKPVDKVEVALSSGGGEGLRGNMHARPRNRSAPLSLEGCNADSMPFASDVNSDSEDVSGYGVLRSSVLADGTVIQTPRSAWMNETKANLIMKEKDMLLYEVVRRLKVSNRMLREAREEITEMKSKRDAWMYIGGGMSTGHVVPPFFNGEGRGRGRGGGGEGGGESEFSSAAAVTSSKRKFARPRTSQGIKSRRSDEEGFVGNEFRDSLNVSSSSSQLDTQPRRRLGQRRQQQLGKVYDAHHANGSSGGRGEGRDISSGSAALKINKDIYIRRKLKFGKAGGIRKGLRDAIF